MSYLDSRSINYNRKIIEKADKYHIKIISTTTLLTLTSLVLTNQAMSP